jgi:hypothetical protein
MLAMMATKIVSTLFLSGILIGAGCNHCLAQDAAQTPSAPDKFRPAYSDFSEIHVDDACHLLPSPELLKDGKKHPHLRKDPVICHLEVVLNSEHVEETLLGNELRRNKVQVSEQTYVLQNITTLPVSFVVEHFVPDGWVVDSDPQPKEIEKSIAVFQVHAQPGEIVRLHVGIRKTTPLKSKTLKQSPLN